ncbi:ArnT family glycosyltransferase [Bordetella holmesii]|uniref:Dolichyl-phosphate-mannose-protein mannosyltransferase n=2 Tax=Bordetella holmesii TaxID=35814 RepID=A0A158M042_9BORD|nr:glycosyltransferase family 39 protein [Bordetella holmesii]AHV93341.1 dolichyl-phosphate-mannose-mannosyltransferase family protein [Bordetella holmesii ATCC 51541]AIT26749.1 dolichyl-phosphate-mannose-mannosyltransferase family protein [Bordetella holmesii 44057]EWM44330.1 dolichyl-phosphate-mannose-mannosyltransferase family protein [Bordetella holmesii 41130]EWM47340.1 dolichyl-phosphate-mannose-mannosyltransferase family protein [Bordetella holmesii 35009]EWM51497.1 dolichyl-phosphate-m
MSTIAFAARVAARPRVYTWLVLTGVALWLMGLAWSRPLTLPDEGRYAGVAWEMLRSHSPFVPLMDGMPYFHKPPLYYWLAQISFALFGLTEWAARLPSLLIAWASVAGIYAFTRRYRGERFALGVVGVLCTMPFFYGGAQFANMDMSVAGMITLCVLAGADTILRVAGGLPWRRMSLATAVLAALAVLAKGLIGIVLPGAILLGWLVMRRDGRGFKALIWPPALAAFAVVALPWFAYMQVRYPGFFHYFFIYQHFERFALSGFNNVQPFWFYPPVLAGLTLPWSLWMGGALRRSFWGAEDSDGLRRLMLIWLVVAVGFFSLPSSKLIGYILPAVPALAFLVTETVMPAWNRGMYRRVWASLAVAAVLCLAGILVATFNPRGGSGPLGEQVRAEAQPYDTMVALHHFPFDLGIYTASTEPVWVVDDWSNPEIPTRDNWRKELFDAAMFEPAIGQRVLVSNATFNERVCAAPNGARFWVWGQPADGDNYAAIRGQSPRFVDGRRQVWLLDVSDAVRQRVCGGTPTGGSPQK